MFYYKTVTVVLSFCLLGWAGISKAETTSGVLAGRTGEFQGQVSGPSYGYTTGTLTLTFNNSCFGSNLRKIPSGYNSLTSSGTINANFVIKHGKDIYLFSVAYPGNMALPYPNLSIKSVTPICFIVKKNPPGVKGALMNFSDLINCSCLISLSGGQKICDTFINPTHPTINGETIVGGYWDVADLGSSMQVKSQLSNNQVVVQIPSTLNLDTSGTVSTFLALPNGKSVDELPTLLGYRFIQSNVDCSVAEVSKNMHKSRLYAAACVKSSTGAQIMGNNGPLWTKVNNFNISTKGDASGQFGISISADIQFAGQVGTCGGRYSPLMLFFGDEKPQFTGTSTFPVSEYKKTYWPEAGSSGAFLVYDMDGKGQIKKKKQLFTDSDEEDNAFEALKKFDSNHDGFISAEDERFNQLYLWFDKNGDSISQKGELEPLSRRVFKISLNYRRSINRIGDRAEEREVADFFFRKVKGKKGVGKGEIIDIWFSPVKD